MDLNDLATYRSEQIALKSNKNFIRSPVISDLTRALLMSDLQVEDSVFDSLLPEYYQLVSAVHFTPIKAIKQLAEFISNSGDAAKLIDIGSGCGKLCIVLSLLTKMNIYGIEQRADQFKVAEKIRSVNNLKNVHFIHGNMLNLDWSDFDIYYLFNPFQEQISDFGNIKIDTQIKLNQKYYLQYTSRVYDQLRLAKPGKKLVTFHGYGGSVPSNWQLTQSRIIGYGNLSMWESME